VTVLVIGGGIGGLTLALALGKAGIASRVFEAAPEIRPLGVGINLLPHAMRELDALGLGASLERVAVATREQRHYNRFGQLVWAEPRGRHAGYDWPQLSIHRGELQRVLLEALAARLGPQAIALGRKCVALEQDAAGVTARFESGERARGECAIGCDGIRSAVRALLVPGEGPPAWQGINMWRGVTRARPFLGGDTMVIVGWLEVGKLVAYPIDRIEADGRQLVNWVAEIQSPKSALQDWSLPGRLEDFYPVFADRAFDWLDCAALLREAQTILEYPMVDRDPLPRWTEGRVTLLGDAAHPMYPRGSNGAGQAILDAAALAACLQREHDAPAGLAAYEAARLEAANAVVLMNRSDPPDAVLREVHRRSGDRPFARLEDVIGPEELARYAESYKRVAGFDRESLARRASPA